MPHLQLKDIPAGTHEALRTRAARDGISMREYVLRLIEADIGRPDTWEETMRRVEGIGRRTEPIRDAAEVVRAGRDERESQLLEAVDPFFR